MVDTIAADQSSNDSESDSELVVLQSSPLAYNLYLDEKNVRTEPLGMLDLEWEENLFTEALDGTNVRLRFEIATCRSLSDFLSQGKRVLHFSGHGTENFVFIENSYGEAQYLMKDNLKDWIEAGGNKLELAFIASCKSKSVGQKFVNAGVKHVVCATDDLLNEAAMVFAGAFYGALHRGRTIKDAYNLAKHRVIHSEDVIWTGLDSKTEADKIVLLPEDRDHDEILFPKQPHPSPSTTAARARWTRTRTMSPTTLTTHMPFPPKPFLGREMEMLNVLKRMIKGERLVTITGDRGIGKESFAKAIGHYMEKRKMWGEQVYWIEDTRGCTYANEIDGINVDDVGSLMCQLMLTIENHSSTTSNLTSFREDRKYREVRSSIFRLLSVKKTVMIINAKKFRCERSIELLSWFIHDLLENTQQTKLLVFHQRENPLKPPQMQGFPFCSYNPIQLEPLKLEDAFKLFGTKCRHACESPSNWRFDEEWYDDRINKSLKLFSILLGSGNPTKTIVLARNITQSEYNKLTDENVGISESDFSELLSHLSNLELERLDLAAGIAYSKQGKYKEASELLERSYDEHKILWGENHSNTLLVMEWLGQLYFKEGNFRKAHPLFENCWTLREEKLGPDDPSTLDAMNKLASNYHSLASDDPKHLKSKEAKKKFDSAEKLYKKCYKKRLEKLGEHHKDTLESLNNLAAYYYKVENYEKSRQLYEDCLPKRQGVLGENHPETLTTLNNLALLDAKQNRWDLAEKRHEDCLRRRKKHMGVDHPNTLSSLNNLGKLHMKQRNYAKAIELFGECLEGRKRVLRDNHPSTEKTRKQLIQSYEMRAKQESLDHQADQGPMLNPQILVFKFCLFGLFAFGVTELRRRRQ